MPDKSDSSPVLTRGPLKRTFGLEIVEYREYNNPFDRPLENVKIVIDDIGSPAFSVEAFKCEIKGKLPRIKTSWAPSYHDGMFSKGTVNIETSFKPHETKPIVIRLKLQAVRCPLSGGTCKELLSGNPNEAFIGYQFESKFYQKGRLKGSISRALKAQSMKAYFPDDHQRAELLTCRLNEKIYESRLSIFEISDNNPNVMLEVGLAMGLGKEIVFLKNKKSRVEVPSDLKGLAIIIYRKMSDIETGLREILSKMFFEPRPDDFRAAP
jgi:hypothetical protein